MPSVGFRPFVVYGPGREVGLTAGATLACRAAARREPYVIEFTGGVGPDLRGDVAAAFEAAVIRVPDGAYAFNLLGEVATVDEVMARIRHHEPGALVSAEGPPLPTHARIAPDDLARVFPGLPRTSLDDGLRRTIEHYRRARGTRRPRPERRHRPDPLRAPMRREEREAPPRRADSNSASTACIVVSESSIGQLRTSPPSTYRENLSTWRRYWFTGSYEDVRVSKAPTLVVSPT